MDGLYNAEELELRNYLCSKIQKKYEFEIPKYILVELIKPSYDKLELNLLINLAVMNNRFTYDEGLILKNKYCY